MQAIIAASVVFVATIGPSQVSEVVGVDGGVGSAVGRVVEGLIARVGVTTRSVVVVAVVTSTSSKVASLSTWLTLDEEVCQYSQGSTSSCTSSMPETGSLTKLRRAMFIWGELPLVLLTTVTSLSRVKLLSVALPCSVVV